MQQSAGIEEDPRFIQGIELFNAADFFEAGDVFEELYFEAIMGELEFIRIFLQLSVGCLHAERRQVRPAIERLGEGILAVDRVADPRGYDLAALKEEMERMVRQLSAGETAAPWPTVLHL
jgi:hypothetical protein